MAEKALGSLSLPKDFDHIVDGALMTSSKHTCLSKVPPTNTVTLRVWASSYEFWKDTNIQSLTAVSGGKL